MNALWLIGIAIATWWYLRRNEPRRGNDGSMSDDGPDVSWADDAGGSDSDD